MKSLYIVMLFIFSVSCAQDKKAVKGDTEFQRELNAEFKDASTSPLKKKDLKTFEGLDFFEFDSVFVVNANLERKPDSKWVKMKTTTSRISEKRIYGIVSFSLNGTDHQLNLYQDRDLMQKEDYADYLFLPFLDETNGETTYGGGRYIDLRIPEGNVISIDFNTAYNPYCAYSERYSCPIVPRENYLGIKIEAGVKSFKK